MLQACAACTAGLCGCGPGGIPPSKVVLLGDFNAAGLGRGQGEFEPTRQHGLIVAPMGRQLRGFLAERT
jgi:hypothetical protein